LVAWSFESIKPSHFLWLLGQGDKWCWLWDFCCKNKNCRNFSFLCQVFSTTSWLYSQLFPYWLVKRWALTRPEHTFDQQQIRGRPVFDPGTFWHNLKGKKLENLGFLGEIFQTQTQTKDGWSDSGQNFWPGPITINYPRKILKPHQPSSAFLIYEIPNISSKIFFYHFSCRKKTNWHWHCLLTLS